MKKKPQVFIFGEVLYDCFPSGEQVLGGAPFNVAWHLQALGDHPRFISRIGTDELGQQIRTSMENWGMDTAALQTDPIHSTGRVEIELIDGEPHYSITPDCAYDFIDAESLATANGSGIFYHGSLALRNKTSRNAFMKFAQNPDISTFLDVNLRSPWWKSEPVHDWMKMARWVKLNLQEMQLLGFDTSNLEREMFNALAQYGLDLLIVTLGAEGAAVAAQNGEFHSVRPTPLSNIIDTVGAGDAFSAIFIHGLISDWSLSRTLNTAQEFAAKIINLRGATTEDITFYREFKG